MGEQLLFFVFLPLPSPSWSFPLPSLSPSPLPFRTATIWLPVGCAFSWDSRRGRNFLLNLARVVSEARVRSPASRGRRPVKTGPPERTLPDPDCFSEFIVACQWGSGASPLEREGGRPQSFGEEKRVYGRGDDETSTRFAVSTSASTCFGRRSQILNETNTPTWFRSRSGRQGSSGPPDCTHQHFSLFPAGLIPWPHYYCVVDRRR